MGNATRVHALYVLEFVGSQQIMGGRKFARRGKHPKLLSMYSRLAKPLLELSKSISAAQTFLAHARIKTREFKTGKVVYKDVTERYTAEPKGAEGRIKRDREWSNGYRASIVDRFYVGRLNKSLAKIAKHPKHHKMKRAWVIRVKWLASGVFARHCPDGIRRPREQMRLGTTMAFQ